MRRNVSASIAQTDEYSPKMKYSVRPWGKRQAETRVRQLQQILLTVV